MDGDGKRLQQSKGLLLMTGCRTLTLQNQGEWPEILMAGATDMDHGTQLFFPAVWGTMALISLVLWQRAAKRSRTLDGLPMSKCRSAAQGYVKLAGKQKSLPGEQVCAPLTGMPCTWWDYRIEERNLRRQSHPEEPEWTTLKQATSPNLIVLDDGTGQVLINPGSAEVAQWPSDSWYGSESWPAQPPMPNASVGRYRYTESRMSEGDMLFVTGQFTTHSAQTGLTTASVNVSDVLAEWKRDKASLLERFDADGNGVIDMDEWGKAREAAMAEANTQAMPNPPAVTADVNMVVKPSDGRPFVLSPVPIESDIDSATSSGKTELALFVFSCVALLWVLRHHH
jgi:hypothetical protein